MRKYCGDKLKRYNSLTFASYEEARKYTRKLVTRLHGKYSDAYTDFGFRISKI
jgi:hypothetical protein